jgi:hypothetical protein
VSMNLFQPITLAASGVTRAAVEQFDEVNRATANFQVPRHWPVQGDLLSFSQNMGPGMAAVLILLGVVYLLYGFNLFKLLIVANAAMLGACLGLMMGDRTGAKWPLAVVGAVLLGAMSWPAMKYAVALMGGTFGALVGTTIWRIMDLDSNYAWSGAAIGLIAGGLLCFILFRGCVMMYTSLQGAVMLIFGILGLLLKYQDVAPRLGSYLTHHNFLLPMCIFVPTVIGMMYQQTYSAPAKAGGSAQKK